MKLKMIAAAVLAAVTLPSFAAIAPSSSGNGELFLVIQDSVGQISYTRDLGITMSDWTGLVPGGSTQDWNLNTDAQFTSFLGQTSANAATYVWAVLASDALGPVTGGAQRLFTTATAGTTDALIQSSGNSALRSGISSAAILNFYNAVNTSGTHGVSGQALDYAVNGSSVNNITDPGVGYFGELGGTGPQLNSNLLPFANTNAIGATSSFYAIASQSANGLIGTAGFTQFGNAGGFATFAVTSGASGYALNYTIPAVPEPSSMALLFAGLGALGFVGRRRQQR